MLQGMRERLKHLVPNAHSRSQKRLYFMKMKGLHANMSYAAANYIYKSLTGDESLDRIQRENVEQRTPWRICYQSSNRLLK